jgi:hypothetical protein
MQIEDGDDTDEVDIDPDRVDEYYSVDVDELDFGDDEDDDDDDESEEDESNNGEGDQ